ncbi:YceI family protein [Robiginitalea sp. SC105]|uniref:YceI family protein n=1 Tax=Robiginitalea sp. SC105 TaxID=2762332 RepID=UPI00163AC86B|nr:YceI family protein [Robiginitalea sp. SC105]MBC2840350.1 YceI family protein [Robiginitalea sp. SC105]
MFLSITNLTKAFSFVALFGMTWKGDVPVRETLVRIHPDSEVIISGTTNLNSFNCRYNLEEKTSPVHVVYEKTGAKYIFSRAQLLLQNSCFDCGGRGINRDFRELLRSEAYPQVHLELLYAQVPEDLSEAVRAGIRITLAGVTRDFETDVICNFDPDLCIYGNFPMQLSDFDLEPPSKVLGMIKVDDQIEVQLNLRLRQQ